MDIDASVAPDVIGSMTDMSAVASDSMDGLFSSHNIEHVYAHEVPVVLGEFRRVLNDRGFAVITCPDLQSVCALVAQNKLTDPAYISSSGPIAPIDILYGHRQAMINGNLYMAHKCGFTKKVLEASLLVAGFQSVIVLQREDHFDLWAIATKSHYEEQDLVALVMAHFPLVSM